MNKLGGPSVKWECDKCGQTIYGSSITHECNPIEFSPYCPVCSGCGEEGCCSPLNCSQDPNGSYCQTYLKDLKFGYKMYDEISKLIDNDPKYEEQIKLIFDRVYEEIYK